MFRLAENLPAISSSWGMYKKERELTVNYRKNMTLLEARRTDESDMKENTLYLGTEGEPNQPQQTNGQIWTSH